MKLDEYGVGERIGEGVDGVGAAVGTGVTVALLTEGEGDAEIDGTGDCTGVGVG